MRCALVEFTPFHGETIATFVHLLTRLGVEVEVFLRSELLDSDPLAHCPALECRTHRLESFVVRASIKTRRFAGYDFVLTTSCEPRLVLPRLARVAAPVIGVVHNAILLAEDGEYRAFFTDPRRVPLVLASHQRRYLETVREVSWIAPVHLMEDPQAAPAGWNRLCVQGWIDFRRRNYADLLDAVARVADSGSRDFEVLMVGKDYGLDGLRFRRAVSERGLADRFVFTGDVPEYAAYLTTLASCGFVLPLIDDSAHLRTYFEDKISSSISIALGLERIPVMHTRLAELYDLAETGIVHGDGELDRAILAALELAPAARQQKLAALRTRREALLDQSLVNLERILDQLGLHVPV
jgi:glycosyltransferase involved in cell wall biosynthesis